MSVLSVAGAAQPNPPAPAWPVEDIDLAVVLRRLLAAGRCPPALRGPAVAWLAKHAL